MGLIKKHKWLILGLVTFFLSFNVFGASFGTFPYQIEKQSSDLEVEYTIGFINPSSNSVEVTLSSEESEEYNLTFSGKNFQISPNSTSDPSGSGWYHLGNGEYTKVHQKSFQVDISRYREDNSLSFPVTIESATVGGSGGEGSQSRMIQVRNYNYRAVIDPELRPEERPEQDDTNSWRDRFWQEDSTDDQEDFNLEQNKSSNQEPRNDETRQSNESELNNSSNQLSDEKEENSLVNNTTLMLVVGIIVALSYIMMEV
jgi:hypothetical protein